MCVRRYNTIFFLGWALALGLCLVGACKERIKKVPVSKAYKDGFEVVVLWDNEVSCLHLREAEKFTHAHPLATYIIPDYQVESIEESLKREHKKLSICPEVYIGIATYNNSKQVVNIAFHYRKSSYQYCYEATNDTLVPLWSSYKGLIKNRRTYYIE